MTSNGIHRVQIGTFDCLVIQDLNETVTEDIGRFFFGNVDPAAWQAEIREIGGDPGALPVSYNCLVVNAGQRWILLDTGYGVLHEEAKLKAVLDDEGIAPEVIVISHAHVDHYGGLVDAEGRSRYPEAEIVVCRDEWDYYTGPYLQDNPDRAPGMQKHFMSVQDQIRLIDCDGEIAPGVRFVAAPGHSKHHAAVLLESDGAALLFAADAYIHPLHVKHPDWQFLYDVDKAQSAQSRNKLAALAAETGATVLSFHFGFPGLGHVIRVGDGYAWRPV
jgi:glyoxylase-like metal-dependent hydrolase (beta-lactamase superfamily II)